MSFGNQTVTFVTMTETGTANRLGVKPKLPTNVPVKGCRHRPLHSSETPEDLGLNTGTQIWKTTAPPDPAALAARATGKLIVDGVTYDIIGGPMTYPDFNGQPFKVTILSTSLGPQV